MDKGSDRVEAVLSSAEGAEHDTDWKTLLAKCTWSILCTALYHASGSVSAGLLYGMVAIWFWMPNLRPYQNFTTSVQGPGSRNCPDNHLLSDLLGSRRFLPGCWSRLLLHSQGRSEPGIAVQSPPRFAWGKHQCLFLNRRCSQTTWWHDHPWKMWEPREFFPVHCKTILGLGIYRRSRSLKICSHCDVLCWSLKERRV